MCLHIEGFILIVPLKARGTLPLSIDSATERTLIRGSPACCLLRTKSKRDVSEILVLDPDMSAQRVKHPDQFDCERGKERKRNSWYR